MVVVVGAGDAVGKGEGVKESDHFEIGHALQTIYQQQSVADMQAVHAHVQQVTECPFYV